jgi:ADP-heptose:LPS heptosyltransferase
MRTIQILQKIFEKDNENFLTGLYRELLNREPDKDGFANHMDSLEKHGKKIEVLKEMVRSNEFGILLSQSKIIHVLQKIIHKNDNEFVKQLYYNIFGMIPKLSQIQKYKEELRNDTSSKAGFIQNLLQSEEIFAKLNHPSISNTTQKFSVLNRLVALFKLDREDCIKELYGELFDKKLEQNEFINYDHFSNFELLSKVEVYKVFINSIEFVDQFNFQSSSNCLKLIQTIINLSDEDFLFEAYRECLDREPDRRGFKYYSEYYLNNGIDRIEIIREILTSNEAKEKLHSSIEKRDKPLQNIEINYSIKQLILRKKVERLLKKHNFPFETNMIFKFGGLGDFIQITPVAKALKAKYPEYPVVVAFKGGYEFKSVLEDHPYIDAMIDCQANDLSFSEVEKSLEGLVENIFDVRYVSRAYGSLKNSQFADDNYLYYEFFLSSICRIDDFNMHVCDVMLHSLGLEQYADCNDVLVTPDEVPEKIPGDYVVVCNSVGSFQGQLKEWTNEEWDELIKWLNSIGIIPVQLGTKSDKLLHSSVMDLRGATTLRQAAGYLKLSRGYIGVEGGLFHLSKAVGTPAVVIFSSTFSNVFAYPDTYVVTKNICRPCLESGTWSEAKCIRGYKSCLNFPDWKAVSVEVSKMLSERRES